MENLVFDQLVQIFPYVVETSLNYHVHNSPQLVCVLTQMNLAHPTLLSLSLSLCNIYFENILLFVCKFVLFSHHVSILHSCTRVSSLSCVLHVPPISCSSLSPDNIWSGLPNFRYFPVSFCLLFPHLLFSTVSWNSRNLRPSFRVRDDALHPCKTAVKLESHLNIWFYVGEQIIVILFIRGQIYRGQ